VASAQRILVVEDEDVLAQNVKTYLGRRSPDVRIAANGRLAMELLESFTPDVLVLDFNLPGDNGLQIYAEIMRRRTHPVGCVMITGCPLGNISRTANEMGIHHLLGKPFRLAELQRLVDATAEEAMRH
jgi:DNA-binding response OmpR family regulator